MMLRCVCCNAQNWNDELILLQNPWLRPLIGNLSGTPVPIQMIVGCGATIAQAPIANSLSNLLTNFAAATNDILLQQWAFNYSAPGSNGLSNNGALSLADATVQCQPHFTFAHTASEQLLQSVAVADITRGMPCAVLLAGLDQTIVYTVYAQNEQSVPSLVLGTIGAQGYFQNDNDPDFAIPTMPYTRNGVSVDTVADVAGIRACAVDTFNIDKLTFDLSNSQTPTCWPWTSQVVAMVRRQYSSTATDASSCTRGLDALQWLRWMYMSSQIDDLINTVNIVQATDTVPGARDAYIAALDSVTCDGSTLLITLPTMWVLSAGVSDFAQALCAIGLVGCMVVAALVAHNHAHPVMRSASPLFLLLSVSGVGLLFISGFVLVSAATVQSCSAFSWLVNFGLQLCFAPLFAKTYRIYRIFGRKKLSVVQLTNRKLFLIVLAILAVEAVLMAVWQAVGPVAAITSDIASTTTTGKLIINEYTQCGVPSGSSLNMFAVICAEKGILFVFGALMAFTTRKVTSTFNESQGISLSIYNLLFTIGIISPIILVVDAVGDVLILLLVFALLWIAYFTGGILFVPKLLTIYQKTALQTAGEMDSASTSSDGYQFLSLAALSTLPMLQGYQSALRKHLETVDSRISHMKHDKHNVGSTTIGHRRAASASGTVKPISHAPTSTAHGRAALNVESSVLSARSGDSTVGKSAIVALFSPASAARASMVASRVSRVGLTSRSSVRELEDSGDGSGDEQRENEVRHDGEERDHVAADALSKRSTTSPVGTKLPMRLSTQSVGSKQTGL